MRVTFRQLKGVIAAAKHGSFSAGARELAMTQPAFSQLISALETSAGVQLFDRTTRRIHLTEVGAQFLGMVERPLGDIEDACLFLRDIAAGKRGRLVFSSVAHDFITSALARFKAAYPNVAVKVLDDPSATLIGRVLRREVDFGVGAIVEPHKDLLFRELLRDEFVAIVQGESALAARRKITWLALRQQPLVLLPRQSSVRVMVDRQLAALAIVREPEYEAQNAIAALSMTRAGLGVTILPQLILSGLNMSGLTAIRIGEPRLERSLGIIARADRSLAPPGAAYVELLFQEIGKLHVDKKAAERRTIDGIKR
jgi:LysR family transcriptional regulator, carnitine catabolism transcriptional activator